MIVKNTHQKTLAKEVQIKGKGLHSGSLTKLKLKPGKDNQGLVFVRIDLTPNEEIPALSNFVVKTDRGTTIGKENALVQTTEHLLAALVGCGVNNCTIEIDGPEVPIMDGSSKAFVEAIQKAGIQD